MFSLGSVGVDCMRIGRMGGWLVVVVGVGGGVLRGRVGVVFGGGGRGGIC